MNQATPTPSSFKHDYHVTIERTTWGHLAFIHYGPTLLTGMFSFGFADRVGRRAEAYVIQHRLNRLRKTETTIRRTYPGGSFL